MMTVRPLPRWVTPARWRSSSALAGVPARKEAARRICHRVSKATMVRRGVSAGGLDVRRPEMLEEIGLAEGDTLGTKDRVGGRDVEEEVGQHEAGQIIPSDPA